MLTTPVYGFRYPELDDPAEGPYAFNALATDVENELKDQVDALNGGLAVPAKGIVGYHRRATSMSAVTSQTETGIIRVKADLKAGRAYRWKLRGGPTFRTGTAGATVAVRLRYTTNGTDPTTSTSNLVTVATLTLAATGTDYTCPDYDYVDTGWEFFVPGSDQDFRILLSFARTSAGTSVSITPQAKEFRMYCEDLGLVTDTGSNL